MIVSHNLTALNTHRNMKNLLHKGQKSFEKLSSGLRINRAGDDAAGLAISEKMRAQIRGIDQASRNAQDGISMIQTAEGGLTETHNILQRMRELATQSANDTNVEIDRQEIQKEINQLTSEINRIANTTEFNTKKLLNGEVLGQSNPTTSSNTSSDIENLVSNLSRWWLEESEQLVFDSYGIHADDVSMSVEFFDDNTDPTAALVAYQILVDGSSPTGYTGQGQNLKLRINLAYSRPTSTMNGGQPPQYVDRVIAHEMVHAIMARSMNFGEISTWFKEGAAEFIHGADERLKGTIYTNGTPNTFDDASVVAVLNAIGDGSEGAWGAGSQESYSAAYVAVRYLDALIKGNGGENQGTNSDSAGIKRLMTYLAADTNRNLDDGLAWLESGGYISNITNTSTWLSETRAKIQSMADLTNKAGIVLNTTQSHENDTGSVLGADATGNPSKSLTAENVLPETEGQSATMEIQPMDYFNLAWSPEIAAMFNNISARPPGYTLQIGANTGQSMTLQFGDMRASALKISGISDGQVMTEDGKVAKYTSLDSGLGGVTDGTNNQVIEYALDISTHENASAAISVIQKAIESVSSERSKLGAYQNRLEHTIANLTNAGENLTSAETRIRDVDIAKEVMEMTRINILDKATQAMLAQANQKPQSILQLLG